MRKSLGLIFIAFLLVARNPPAAYSSPVSGLSGVFAVRTIFVTDSSGDLWDRKSQNEAIYQTQLAINWWNSLYPPAQWYQTGNETIEIKENLHAMTYEQAYLFVRAHISRTNERTIIFFRATKEFLGNIHPSASVVTVYGWAETELGYMVLYFSDPQYEDGGTLTTMGRVAHEMGHWLGASDKYDRTGYGKYGICSTLPADIMCLPLVFLLSNETRQELGMQLIEQQSPASIMTSQSDLVYELPNPANIKPHTIRRGGIR